MRSRWRLIAAQGTVADCATTAITSSAAALTSGDVGYAVTIPTAELGGYNLSANVVSVTNPTMAALDTRAIASITAQTLNVYNRDIITGGTTVATKSGIMFRIGYRHSQYLAP